VFGNREAWVQQPPQPYFYKVMRAAGPLARLSVTRVMSRVTRDIT
jgi:hypothetical protein